MLRAAYMAQELLTTFTDDMHGVLLQPSEVSGSYIIRVDAVIVFDRIAAGRFPEIKELKQLIRDMIAPRKRFRPLGQKIAYFSCSTSGNSLDIVLFISRIIPSSCSVESFNSISNSSFFFSPFCCFDEINKCKY